MSASPSEAEHLDVLVVGAGLSGVGVVALRREQRRDRTGLGPSSGWRRAQCRGSCAAIRFRTWPIVTR